MKALLGIVVLVWAAGSAVADPTVVNTLGARPLTSLKTAEGTITLAFEPGTRTEIPPSLFSGLGQKELALQAGTTYYLAQFGAVPGVYRLAEGQVLVVNQSGRALEVTVAGLSGTLAVGTPVLGALDGGVLKVLWDDGTGPRSQELTAGLYRWTEAGLIRWNAGD